MNLQITWDNIYRAGDVCLTCKHRHFTYDSAPAYRLVRQCRLADEIGHPMGCPGVLQMCGPEMGRRQAS